MVGCFTSSTCDSFETRGFFVHTWIVEEGSGLCARLLFADLGQDGGGGLNQRTVELERLLSNLARVPCP